MVLCAEERLILLLSRGKILGPEEDEARQLLRGRLRWDHFLDIAVHESVYPLVYRNLSRLEAGHVPSKVHESLDRRYRANALRNEVMARELEDVLALLSNVGIPAIPLKGVLLSAALYGDRALRVCLDMDVLVPTVGVTRVVRLLRQREYVSEVEASDFFVHVLLAQDIEFHLRKSAPMGDHWLELHWALLWGPQWDSAALKDLWREARPRNDLRVGAYGLSREWEVLYLSAHAARHRWRGLKWLVDIDALCSSPDIDWKQVKEKAEAFGWTKVVDVTLAVCHSLFGSEVPEPFCVRSPPRWVACFPQRPTRSMAASDALAFMRLLRSPLRKVLYLGGVVFVPTLAERRAVQLPPLFGFLYYVVRPLRLAAKWGKRLVRAAFEHQRSPVTM
jgi:hypothetical protein